MKKYAGAIVKFLLFFGLGILLVWLVTHQLTTEQREKIRESFQNAHYWLLIPVVLLGISSHLVRALRWRLLMHPLGYAPSVFNVFAAVMIGYLANLAVPRMGEITRCGVLARNEKIPVDKLIGTMIAERVIDLLCLIILLLLTVLTQLEVLGDFFYRNIAAPFLVHFHASGDYKGVVLILLPVAALVIAYLLLRAFRNTKWYHKLRNIVLGIRDGLVSFGKLRHKGWFVLYTFLIWSLYLGMVYTGFYCLDSTSHLGLEAALAVLGFGSIGMIATQGGIGAYQLIVARTLTLYGISEGIGYAFGWISWLAQTLLIVVLGFLCMLLLAAFGRRNGQRRTVKYRM